MLSCKESARLISDAQDRPLKIMERMLLEMHLLICVGCARYRKQINFLHQACRQHPARPYSDKEKRHS